MRLRKKARGPESWVIYQTVVKGEVTGPMGVCEQAEIDEMERLKPGGTFLIQAGILDEAVAERLARGKSGDPVPRVPKKVSNG